MRMSDADLTVLKDACGVHENFTNEELSEIHKMAQGLKRILDASKDRIGAEFARTQSGPRGDEPRYPATPRARTEKTEPVKS